MSFILTSNSGKDLQVNAWNWRPTIEILRAENLLDDEECERMVTHGCGGGADAILAMKMAAVIERQLSAMQPGQRVLADLTIASQPKKMALFTPRPGPRIDVSDPYSATYEWLTSFRDFCNESGGFVVS